MNPLVDGVPGPVIPFNPATDLQCAKIDALLARVRTLQSVCALQAQEILGLRRELLAERELADSLAADLEAAYALQDQGAAALAVLAEVERGNS